MAVTAVAGVAGNASRTGGGDITVQRLALPLDVDAAHVQVFLCKAREANSSQRDGNARNRGLGIGLQQVRNG